MYTFDLKNHVEKMTKNVMKGNNRSLLKKFCLEGTILGLKYFYLYPDPISRCFWAATLILIVAFACNMTMLLYNRFDQMPTRITIENQYEPLTSLPYPTLTICSPNQMTISSMKHFNKTLVDGNTDMDLEDVLPQLLGYYEIISELNKGELHRLQNLIYQNRYTVPEVMGFMPQSCDDFLKLCIFRMRRHACRDMFHPLLTKHGLCCAFNSVYVFRNKIRNERKLNFTPELATTLGLSDALRVVVDYNPDDAIDGTVLQAGATRVMFTDSSEFPADDESILVHPGVEAFAAIHGTYTYCSEEVASLPSWSRECYFEHEGRLPHFRQYHNSDCDHMCYVRALERYCQCMPLYVPHIRSEQACNFTNIDCIIKVRRRTNKASDQEECVCLRDCESRRYTVDLSLGNLKALPYITINAYEDVNFTESTTILHFFFPSSVYVKKKQETVMSLISLASNLGGIFGLCLGCSVFSVLEIVFYIAKAIQNCLTRRLRRAVETRVQKYNDSMPN